MKRKLIIKRFLRSRKLKTIWFNFKVLPFSQAVKLPFFIFGKSTFRSLKGRIIINGPITPGMIQIGRNVTYVGTNIQHTIWIINGKLIFNGPVNILHGSYILVSRNGTLSIGSKGTVIGSDCKILCFDSITIGDMARITWECQIMDTSFHYVGIDGNKPGPLTKPVRIGNNVWIGNRATISKGVVPDNTIVTTYSLVNKDFSDIEPYSMLAGIPAKIKRSNVKRVFDTDWQKELDAEYGYDRTHL